MPRTLQHVSHSAAFWRHVRLASVIVTMILLHYLIRLGILFFPGVVCVWLFDMIWPEIAFLFLLFLSRIASFLRIDHV
jgi:hypothetical protein